MTNAATENNETAAMPVATSRVQAFKTHTEAWDFMRKMDGSGKPAGYPNWSVTLHGYTVTYLDFGWPNA